jgi:hypothetical protein
MAESLLIVTIHEDHSRYLLINFHSQVSNHSRYLLINFHSQVSTHSRYFNDYLQLSNDYLRLFNDYLQLFNDYRQIFNNYLQLFNDYLQLFNDYLQLFNDYLQFFNDYLQLFSVYLQLFSDYPQLFNDYLPLFNEYLSLLFFNYSMIIIKHYLLMKRLLVISHHKYVLIVHNCLTQSIFFLNRDSLEAGEERRESDGTEGSDGTEAVVRQTWLSPVPGREERSLLLGSPVEVLDALERLPDHDVEEAVVLAVRFTPEQSEHSFFPVSF